MSRSSLLRNETLSVLSTPPTVSSSASGPAPAGPTSISNSVHGYGLKAQTATSVLYDWFAAIARRESSRSLPSLPFASVLRDQPVPSGSDLLCSARLLSFMIDHCSNAGFVEWIEQQKGGSLFISVISIAKTEQGIWARFLNALNQSQSFSDCTRKRCSIGQPVIDPHQQAGSRKIVHTADFELGGRSEARALAPFESSIDTTPG